jgi:hypothetical protein
MQPSGVVETAKASHRLQDLLAARLSVGFDDIRRDLVRSGELKCVVEEARR